MTGRGGVTLRVLAMLVLAAGAGACRDLTAPPAQVAPVTAPIDTQAARTAWAFVDQNTTAATGLANVIYPFQFITAWDIGSQIAATYSAHALGVITDQAYDTRIRAILSTLEQAPLFEGAAFNKTYDAHTGQMVDRARQPSPVGYGWSSTDIGRLLVWLRIVAVNEPRYAPLATAVVNRLDMSRLVRGGQLWGRQIDPVNGTLVDYAESGLGYEQYAAAGFALWGHSASTSLDASANTRTVDILGVPVTVDARGNARITSEPYVMMGLETGFSSPALRGQAKALLAAQEARFNTTGILTMVSEDALPDPPYYFYYYSLFHNDRSFVVEGPDDSTYVEQPRWASTKAAFGWHALFPDPYTTRVLSAVQRAAIPGRGWGAGVYESSLRPAGEPSINTAALVLESILYQARGRPMLP